MVRRFGVTGLLVSAGLSFGCASAPKPAEPTPEPPVLDVSPPDYRDLLDLALQASGYEEEGERALARKKLNELLASVTEGLEDVEPPEARGRALLERLHQGVMGTYDARATTLRSILDEGRFNCLSSCVLFNLASEELGLNSRAQLLPTHARSLLAFEDSIQPTVVETTSPKGYDPDEKVAQEILAQVAHTDADPEARTLVPDTGVTVSNVVLIGAMYVNRASIAQESGQIEEAERLFSKGESLAPDGFMRTVLRAQRAALLSQLAVDDVRSGEVDRIRRGYLTLIKAVQLGPTDAQVRSTVLRNLRAAAERTLAMDIDEGKEAEALRVFEQARSMGLKEEDVAGLSAFTYSELARLRLKNGDHMGAVDAIERAREQHLGRSDRRLAAAIRDNWYAITRAAALRMAKQGDYDNSVALIDRLQKGKLSEEQRQETEKTRVSLILLAGQKRVDRGEMDSAVSLYLSGLNRYPNEPVLRHNTIAALERLLAPLVNEGKCEEAEASLNELVRLDPTSKFHRGATARCASIEAIAAIERKDYASASQLLMKGLRAQPKSHSMAKNLTVALESWLRAEPDGKACATFKQARRALHDALGGKNERVSMLSKTCARR